MGAKKGSAEILILGIGNLLMGDEGVGVHVVRHLQDNPLPDGVECLDGGTGSLLLLEPMQRAKKVILIDATVDGAPVGTISRIIPRFASDYPSTLTAHDIGLRDLLDVFYLLGDKPDVLLFAVSIPSVRELSLELSPEVASVITGLREKILKEVATLLWAVRSDGSLKPFCT